MYDKLINWKLFLEQRNETMEKYCKIIIEWKDNRENIKLLRDKINTSFTYDLQKLLDEYIKRDKQYEKLFKDYEKVIVEKGYNQNYKMQLYFVSISQKFYDLSRRLKDIENESKKYRKNRREITYSADGRKKYIHSSLLNEYNRLSEKKRQLLPEYTKLYHKFVSNNFDILKLETDSEDYCYRQYIELTKLVNELQLNCKIEKTQQLITSIQHSGDILSNPSEVVVSFKEITAVDSKKESKTGKGIHVVGHYPVLHYKVYKRRSYSKNVESDEKVIFYSQSASEYQKHTKIRKGFNEPTFVDKLKKIKSKLSNLVSDVKLSRDKHFEIIKSRKPKKKVKLSKKLANTAILVALSITTSLSAFGLSKLNNENSTNNDEISISYSNESPNDLIPLFDNFISRDNVKTESNVVTQTYQTGNDKRVDKEESTQDATQSNHQIIDEPLKINDNIVLENNEIYNNMYDAVYRTNGKKAYFSNDTKRYIKCIVLKYNEKILYLTSQDEIDDLISKKAEIVAVGTSAYNDEYEGFYPSQDVKVLYKDGGITR